MITKSKYSLKFSNKRHGEGVEKKWTEGNKLIFFFPESN